MLEYVAFKQLWHFLEDSKYYKLLAFFGWWLDLTKLIYISNTKIPSNKANTYQSFCMCDAFSVYFDEIEFWHPSRSGDYAAKEGLEAEQSISQLFEDYKLNKNFSFKRLPSIDIAFLSLISLKFWFYLQSISFSISCLVNLSKADKDSVIFVRDGIFLSFLSLGKRVGFFKQRVFFEAHKFSKREEKFARNIDGVVAINNYIRTLYEGRWRHTIITAHDSVDRNEISHSTPEHLDHVKSTKVILYAGNMFRWKGVYTLVDAAEYLPPTCRLIFVGGSEDTLPEFKSYAAGNKRVEILGYRPRAEVMQLMRKADVLVLPNSAHDRMTSYTSPLKLFEYMAARRPIVASRVPSIQEVLIEGKNAVLFEADNPVDLAAKITWVIEHDCSELVDQAWRDVKEYTWDCRAQKIVDWMRL